MNGFHFFLVFFSFLCKNCIQNNNNIIMSRKMPSFSSAHHIVFLISFDWKNKLKVFSTRKYTFAYMYKNKMFYVRKNKIRKTC